MIGMSFLLKLFNSVITVQQVINKKIVKKYAARKLIDEEYESKIKKIDELLKKREVIRTEKLPEMLNESNMVEKENFISRKTMENNFQSNTIYYNNEKIIDFSKISKIILQRKKKVDSREDDLFEEIYGKFGENYVLLVGEYTQTLLKMDRCGKRNFMTLSLFGASIGIFITLIVPIFWI